MVEPVPTVPELARRGLARPAQTGPKGAVTHYQLSPEGQQMIYDAMARNAAEFKAPPEVDHG